MSEVAAESRVAVVVGAGPNGLTAAATLARAGWSVEVVESNSQPGGGSRTAESTLQGFRHDVCSAVHPMGCLSPAFSDLDLAGAGLNWIHPGLSLAHPFDDEPPAFLSVDLDECLAALDAEDRAAYRHLVEPLLAEFDRLLPQLLHPFGIKTDVRTHLRFGLRGLQPASRFARACFGGKRARALFAGCAAHSVRPMEAWATTAFGLIFLLSGHRVAWPVARGGSQAITDALVARLTGAGGSVHCERTIDAFSELPEADLYLFDIDPGQVSQICRHELPSRYRRALESFRYGPAVFKVDYALSQPIPWKDPECLRASTVHVGGAFEEIAASEARCWLGHAPERPFVIVCQQSLFDDSRAPSGQHTGYAYCHVPYGWRASALEALEAQIERFAPGFSDCVLKRHVVDPEALQRYNPSCRGGSITGGANTLWQLLARPALRIPPHSTPNRRILLCSHSTPPGGGVHGMCGYNAAQFVLRSR